MENGTLTWIFGFQTNSNSDSPLKPNSNLYANLIQIQILIQIQNDIQNTQ